MKKTIIIGIVTTLLLTTFWMIWRELHRSWVRDFLTLLSPTTPHFWQGDVTGRAYFPTYGVEVDVNCHECKYGIRDLWLAQAWMSKKLTVHTQNKTQNLDTSWTVDNLALLTFDATSYVSGSGKVETTVDGQTTSQSLGDALAPHLQEVLARMMQDPTLFIQYDETQSLTRSFPNMIQDPLAKQLLTALVTNNPFAYLEKIKFDEAFLGRFLYAGGASYFLESTQHPAFNQPIWLIKDELCEYFAAGFWADAVSQCTTYLQSINDLLAGKVEVVTEGGRETIRMAGTLTGEITYDSGKVVRWIAKSPFFDLTYEDKILKGRIFSPLFLPEPKLLGNVYGVWSKGGWKSFELTGDVTSTNSQGTFALHKQNGSYIGEWNVSNAGEEILQSDLQIDSSQIHFTFETSDAHSGNFFINWEDDFTLESLLLAGEQTIWDAHAYIGDEVDIAWSWVDIPSGFVLAKKGTCKADISLANLTVGSGYLHLIWDGICGAKTDLVFTLQSELDDLVTPLGTWTFVANFGNKFDVYANIYRWTGVDEEMFFEGHMTWVGQSQKFDFAPPTQTIMIDGRDVASFLTQVADMSYPAALSK